MVNFPGFIGPAYQSKSWKASAQRSVNLYFEGDPEKGGVLFGTPGTTLLATLSGHEIILAMLETPNCLVVASSSQVNTYSGVAAGSLVAGSVVAAPISISQYVSIAQAGSLVMLVNGTNGYSFDRTNPLSQPTLIVSPGFRASPQYCTALNGRFIVNWPDTDEFSWSDPFAVTFDPLEFASAEMLNDKLVRPVVLERELYLIGQTSTEVWAGVSTIDVFAPIQGTFIPYGTIAPETACAIGQALLWLSRDANGQGIVIRVRGLQAQRVSTHAIEEEISTYSTIRDAYAWVYQQQGHEFYVLSFPTAHKTWVFDLTTNMWHERASTVLVPVPEPPADGSQLSPLTITHTGVNEDFPEADLSFVNNGTQSVQKFPGGATTALSNWYVPTTVAIGTTHWIRVTQTGGLWGTKLLYSGPTLNTWVQMTSGPVIFVSSNQIGHWVATLLIEIAKTAIGPALVSATYTFDWTVT